MNKPTPLKRILFILHIPPPIHGSSIVGSFLNKSLVVNNEFDCKYINLMMSRNIIETGKSKPIKIYRFILVFYKFIFELIAKKTDLCYIAITVSGPALFKDVLLVAVLRLFKIKRLYHLHNKGVSLYRKSKLYDFYYRFVFKGADVILLSKNLYKDVEPYVSMSNVYICPNGIIDDVANYKPILQSKDKKVNILFLSNLIDSKGVSVLLEACHILMNKGLNFECNFIGAEGDINVEQFNFKVHALGLQQYVNYLGTKYYLEKKEYFKSADIFAFPTFYKNECFPLVILEAMSFSLPVVSTFEGGIIDQIEDGLTGFIVEQKNINALSSKLEVLILNPELRLSMGELARKKYENEFTLDKFEIRIKEILQSSANK